MRYSTYSVLLGFGLMCLALLAVAKITSADTTDTPRPVGMRQALELLTKKPGMPSALVMVRTA